MTLQRKVLIQFANPNIQRSRVNRSLLAQVEQLPHVTVNKLYETYPDFFINVKREKELLEQAQLLVFHHPFYWYSSPAIIKEWQDAVLEYGWAYGPEGDKLRGKDFMMAVTTGGGPQAYQPDGNNRFTIQEFMRPFEQTAHLCGMNFLKPFVVHSANVIAKEDLEIRGLEYRNLLENYLSIPLSTREVTSK